VATAQSVFSVLYSDDKPQETDMRILYGDRS